MRAAGRGVWRSGTGFVIAPTANVSSPLRYGVSIQKEENVHPETEGKTTVDEWSVPEFALLFHNHYILAV